MNDISRPNGDDAQQSMRRILARDAIASGRLPGRTEHRTWGGSGDGTICPVCRLQTPPDIVGYELEFADGNSPGRTSFLHIPCYLAWVDECAGVQSASHATNGKNGKHFNGSGGSGPEDPR